MAISPAIRKTKRRFSPLILFLFILGVLISYFMILVSFAVNGSDVERKKDHFSTRLEEQAEAVDTEPSPLSSHRPPQSPADALISRNSPKLKPKTESDKVLTTEFTPSNKQEQARSVSRTAATASEFPFAKPQTRGRDNFRNVVIPNLPFRGGSTRKIGRLGKPLGEGVNPQILLPSVETPAEAEATIQKSILHPDPSHVLKAYVEPIDFKEWETKPLPVRSTASADQLEEIIFPKLNSCNNLPEMIPADEYPEHDPFLPWIHDVFPTGRSCARTNFS